MGVGNVVVRALVIAGLCLLVGGCEKPKQQETEQPSRPAMRFSIVSGSENKSLEPILQAFGREHNVSIDVTYMGSVDISREIGKGQGCEFDAVWPASSLWVALGDTNNLVRHSESIMRSPVVFCVKKPVAQRLGWIGRDVTVQEILEAAESRKLRFAMTSATQSNSGASAYLAFLTAFAGSGDVLQGEDLNDPAVADKIRRFLRSVNRSSGSSGWLMETMLEKYDLFDAMVNYEALAIEANRELVRRNRPALYVVYPVDGVMIADSPLGFIEHGREGSEAFFLDLQRHLMSPEVQKKIRQAGRRTGLIGGQMAGADASVFNPDWGIDVERVLSPIRTPAGPVVRDALNLYQTAFRKPSLTAFVLDFSGSMQDEGEKQLKQAMRTLLDPRMAKQYLLQASPEDLTFVVPFNDRVINVLQAEGNSERALLGLLEKIEQQGAGGQTDVYVACLKALELLREPAATGKYHTSVILMSDGRSDGTLEQFMHEAAQQGLGRDVPVYTILFGAADPKQMESLAHETGGRMFDGRKDVVKAFRKAKGYN